jgi:putative ABC transport system permease protein
VWRVTLREVVTHWVRYALTAVAIVLGVAFVAGTFVLTDTINSTFDGLFNSIYHSTDAVVRAPERFNPGTSFVNERALISASLLDTVLATPGVKAACANSQGYAQLVGPNGKAIGVTNNGPPTLGQSWCDVAALNPLKLLPGSEPPRSNSQIVIDKHSADVGHFKVGDTVTVLTQRAPASYTISGVAKWGTTDSPLGASITVFTPEQAATVLGTPGMVNQINVQSESGVSQDQLVASLRASIHDPRVEVTSGTAITTEGQKQVRQALSFFGTFLLIFAFIALFVGAFLIFNTFSIVVAQRSRELALLRALGASRRQVTRSVTGESLVLGVVAAVVGLGAGIALAWLLKVALKAAGIDIPASGLVVSARTVVASLVVGIGLTVVAALWPARRAGKVPPVQAMQRSTIDAGGASTRRSLIGAIVTAVGAGLLWVGLFAHVKGNVAIVGAGAAALFVGVTALGPTFARPLARLIGAPLRWRGPSGQLAQANAMRNPTRTAGTAAALMIGVALISTMSIVAQSVKASVTSVISSAMRADYVVNSGANPQAGGGSGFSPDLAQSLQALPEVSVASGVAGGIAQVFGSTQVVLAADPLKVASLFNLGVTHGTFSTMTRDSIAVSSTAARDNHLAIGSPVRVIFSTTGPRQFHVGAIYTVRQLAGDYVITTDAARANFPQLLDFQVYVRLAPGVSPAAGRAAIEPVLAAYPTATLLDQAQYKADQAKQVDQLLNLVYGLLALAILIALIGIANTLVLSIHERTRELGMLRAVGMTRPQLRSSVRYESLIISMFGTVEGLVVGVLLGWALVAALHSSGIDVLQIPVGQLITVAVIAGVAGVLAAISPSRRAAKLDVLRAISTE